MLETTESEEESAEIVTTKPVASNEKPSFSHHSIETVDCR
jgi:hypothetical protein